MPSNALETIKVKVEQDGVEETNEQLQDLEGGEGELIQPSGGGEVQEEGGGTVGDMFGGLMESISSMSMTTLGILAGLGAIVGILASMEPIQAMMSAFMNVVQAFFLPLAMMLVNLLSPVLRAMIKLLPKWMAFFDDPVGNIIEGLRWVWQQMKRIPQLIIQRFSEYLSAWKNLGSVFWNALKQLGSWIWSRIKSGINFIKQLPSRIWSFMKQIPGAIVNGLRGVLGIGSGKWEWTNPKNWFQTGGMVKETGVYGLHRGEAVIPADDIRTLVREMRNNMGGNKTRIQISGGLAPFIETVSKDPNLEL